MKLSWRVQEENRMNFCKENSSCVSQLFHKLLKTPHEFYTKQKSWKVHKTGKLKVCKLFLTCQIKGKLCSMLFFLCVFSSRFNYIPSSQASNKLTVYSFISTSKEFRSEKRARLVRMIWRWKEIFLAFLRGIQRALFFVRFHTKGKCRQISP